METYVPELLKTRRIEQREPKPKKVYHGRVTVCIAATCQENKEPRIVVCSDTRLSYGEIGSTDAAVKVDVLGHGWIAQMAGNWSSARGLCSTLKQGVQSLPAAGLQSLLSECQTAVKRFSKSPLYDPSDTTQLLLSGFEGSTGHIVEVSIDQGNPRVELKNSFAAIGAGTSIAVTLLSLRQQQAEMPLSYVTYLVYEAKRASEKSGNVGPFTTVLIQAPNIEDFRNRAYVKMMNEVGKAHLEAVYHGMWKVPFIDIPELTADFFFDLGAPQSPQ